jgi:hypothetical protein
MKNFSYFREAEGDLDILLCISEIKGDLEILFRISEIEGLDNLFSISEMNQRNTMILIVINIQNNRG